MPQNLVLRRVVTKGFNMASLHPVLGPIFWYFVDESDCNAPDHYGLTNYPDHAHIFGRKYDRYYSRGRFFSEIMSGGCKQDIDYDEVNDKVVSEFGCDIGWLAREAGCSKEDFYQWVVSTKWVEHPAIPRIRFLSDLNGYMGYRPEWTDDPSRALSFTSSCLESDDPDVEIAKGLGEFVSAQAPFDNLQSTSPEEQLNYALLADIDFTLHKLGLSSGDVDHLERSQAYSAAAGRAMARCEGIIRTSPHLSGVPDLERAFQMGFKLEIWKLADKEAKGA